jgi:hypothetical protein
LRTDLYRLVFRAGRRWAFRVFDFATVFVGDVFRAAVLARDDFRVAVMPADLATEAAFRFAALVPVPIARFADLTALSVSAGASRRAMPAAATAPIRALVIPMVSLQVIG